MRTIIYEKDALKLEILPLGCHIISLQYKSEGKYQEVTLQYDNPMEYKQGNPFYLNSAIGPHAGRIKSGMYIIKDKLVKLETNNNGNHLHGGSTGFHTLAFETNEVDGVLIATTYDAYNQIKITITYRIIGSSLSIDMIAVPDVDQVINMTQHTYFNLGEDLTIHNHRLSMHANRVALLDESGVPNGEFLEVTDTPFDFRSSRLIGDALGNYHPQFDISNNIDHPFETLGNPIYFECESSNIGVEVSSNADYTVIYAANYFDDSTLLKGKGKAQKHQALAIEPQDLPNGVNLKFSNQQIYLKGEASIRKIKYRFYNLEKDV